MNPRYNLTLFVTPESSRKALQHLYAALSALAYNDYELEIVDALKEPGKAQKANIIGTPALIYHSESGPVVLDKVSDPKLIRRMLGIPSLTTRVTRRQHREAT